MSLQLLHPCLALPLVANLIGNLEVRLHKSALEVPPDAWQVPLVVRVLLRRRPVIVLVLPVKFPTRYLPALPLLIAPSDLGTTLTRLLWYINPLVTAAAGVHFIAFIELLVLQLGILLVFSQNIFIERLVLILHIFGFISIRRGYFFKSLNAIGEIILQVWRKGSDCCWLHFEILLLNY